MAITPNQLAAITQFYPVSIMQWLWVASIANTAAPTFAELDGGYELTPVMAGHTGFTVSSNMIDTPNYAARFTGQIAGRITAEASSITVYMDRLQVDARTLMPRDTTGYIVKADGGLSSAKGHVFKVTVSTVAPLIDTNSAAMLRFDYAILQQPSENVDLPQT